MKDAMPSTPKRRSRPRRITLQDVAQKSGFSPSTVSIVLSEAPLSRYVAARRVLDALREGKEALDPVLELLPPELVVRDSTAPPRQRGR